MQAPGTGAAVHDWIGGLSTAEHGGCVSAGRVGATTCGITTTVEYMVARSDSTRERGNLRK